MERRESKYQWTWTASRRKSKEYSVVNLDNRNVWKINSRHEHTNQFSHQHDQGTLLDQRITSKNASKMLKSQWI